MSKASYPKVDLQIPMQVVSSVSRSNGMGGTNTVNYSYGGLKAEQGTGRGMLGFRWMKSVEAATGVEGYTEYRQDFPFTGMAAKNETRLAGAGNAGVLKRSTSTPNCQIPQTASACALAPGNRYFLAVTGTVEESWDLNGSPFPTVTSQFTYGQNPQYGDPTQIWVSNGSGSSTTTTNEYWPPVITSPTSGGKWIMGRLKKASVTSVTP